MLNKYYSAGVIHCISKQYGYHECCQQLRQLHSRDSDCAVRIIKNAAECVTDIHEIIPFILEKIKDINTYLKSTT